jgi:hypothetical protein
LARTVVGAILVDALDRLDSRYPNATGDKRNELRLVRQARDGTLGGCPSAAT